MTSNLFDFDLLSIALPKDLYDTKVITKLGEQLVAPIIDSLIKVPVTKLLDTAVSMYQTYLKYCPGLAFEWLKKNGHNPLAYYWSDGSVTVEDQVTQSVFDSIVHPALSEFFKNVIIDGTIIDSEEEGVYSYLDAEQISKLAKKPQEGKEVNLEESSQGQLYDNYLRDLAELEKTNVEEYDTAIDVIKGISSPYTKKIVADLEHFRDEEKEHLGIVDVLLESEDIEIKPLLEKR